MHFLKKLADHIFFSFCLSTGHCVCVCVCCTLFEQTGQNAFLFSFFPQFALQFIDFDLLIELSYLSLCCVVLCK